MAPVLAFFSWCSPSLGDSAAPVGLEQVGFHPCEFNHFFVPAVFPNATILFTIYQESQLSGPENHIVPTRSFATLVRSPSEATYPLQTTVWDVE